MPCAGFGSQQRLL